MVTLGLLLMVAAVAWAGALVLLDQPWYPVDPQPRRDMRIYAYDPRMPNVRWQL